MKAGHAIDADGIDFDDAMSCATVWKIKLLTLRQAARQGRKRKKKRRKKRKAKA